MSQFRQGVQTILGLQLTEEQEAAFARYVAELAEWNQRINLTAIDQPTEIEVKHFLDSLSAWLALRAAPEGRVIDVGAGAGFPGLPLKILHPALDLTLVEATGKKADFLTHMVQVLRLEGVTVLALRAEEVGQDPTHREQYDWAIARALAPMPVLAEYLLPLLRVGGVALAMKGRDVRVEMQAGQAAIEEIGGQLGALHEVQVPGLDEERYLVELNKVAATPAKYPRRPGMPSKRPLE